MDFKSITEFLVERFPKQDNELRKAIVEYQQNQLIFANPKAKEFWEEHECPKITTFSGKGNKVTKDDVRKAIGEEVKGKTSPSAWTSAARKLAEENDLTEDDFPVKTRTGRKLKTADIVQISVADVKAKIASKNNKEDNSRWAKTVAEKAKEHDLSPSMWPAKFKSVGSDKADERIRMVDVEAKIKELEENEAI